MSRYPHIDPAAWHFDPASMNAVEREPHNHTQALDLGLDDKWHDDFAIARHLAAVRWGDGHGVPVCPHCQRPLWQSATKPRLFGCSEHPRFRRSVTADMLIEATNAYGATRTRFAPLHFFQMSTDPLPDDVLRDILPGGEGCWDTALVMSSFRRDAAGRVIIGAIGSLDHPAAGLHRAWARRKLSALFPQLGDAPLHYAWSGAIANTADHLPKILRLGPRGYAAFGYSGRGIGTGTLFGRALARACLTGSEADLPLTPVDRHAERFCTLRGIWYETGALAAHALGSRRPAPRLG